MKEFYLCDLQQGDELVLFKKYRKKVGKHVICSCTVITSDYVKNSFNEIVPIPQVMKNVNLIIRNSDIIAIRSSYKERLRYTSNGNYCNKRRKRNRVKFER